MNINKFRVGSLTNDHDRILEPNLVTNSCDRCYKMKKKCLKEFPLCSNCIKGHIECVYHVRQKKHDMTIKDSKTESLHEPEVSMYRDIVSKVLDCFSYQNIGKESNKIKRLLNNEALSLQFIKCYQANYDIYPFTFRNYFIQIQDSFDLTKEDSCSFYLMLSMGCLISDSINSKHDFAEYFYKNRVEFIFNTINPQILESNVAKLLKLLLLALYYVQFPDKEKVWDVLGISSILLIKLDFFRRPSDYLVKSSPYESQRNIFWSNFILDKQLSLLLDRPSQLPNLEFITIHTFDNSKFPQFIELADLHESINNLKLRKSFTESQIENLHRRLQNWQSGFLTSLPDNLTLGHRYKLTMIINIQYHYLSVEINQVSNTNIHLSSQRFISEYLQLGYLDFENQPSIGVTFDTLFYRIMLKRVIKFNVINLPELIRDDPLHENVKIFQLFSLFLNMVTEKEVNFNIANIENLKSSVKNLINLLKDYKNHYEYSEVELLSSALLSNIEEF